MKNNKLYFLFALAICFGAIIGYFYFIKDNIDPLYPRRQRTLKVIEDQRTLVNLPLYLAISKDFFDNEGLKIVLSTAKNGEEPLEIINNQKTSDIYLCGPEEIIYLYQMNKDNNLKYFYNLSEREGSYIISRENYKDFKIPMFKGKTIIASPRGTLREMVLEKFLHDNSLAPQRSLNIIQTLTSPENSIAFISGSGNFIKLTEPEASRLIGKHYGFSKVSLSDKISPMLNKGFITSNEYISAHPKVLQSFSDAMYKAQLYIQDEPIESYIQLIKKYFPEYTLNELIKGIENYKRSAIWAADPTPTEDKFSVTMKIMDSAGELRTKLQPDLFTEKMFTLKSVKTIKKRT